MDQTTPLPLAKLTAPRVGEVLSRTRLFKQLDSMAAFPVTWISGPAGAGKTTLAISYLQSKKLTPYWYQIDEGDHDLASFFYHLGLLGQQINPDAEQLPLLTPEYLQGLQTFARNFFRQFFSLLPNNSVFVLDNYQDAGEDNPIDALLPIAAQEIPSTIHVLALSRTTTPDNLTRLITSGHVQALNWQALQFSEDEVCELIKNKFDGSNLSDNDIVRLHSQTQGWAAGLTLYLTQHITNDTFKPFNQSQSQTEIFKYFASELFEQSDDEIRKFLLQTAFLPNINIETAKQITCNSNAHSILNTLVNNNFFTYQLNSSVTAFEYHPLLRDFLSNLAHSELSKKARLHLMKKTADILISDKQLVAGIDLLINANSWDKLPNLIIKNAESLIKQGRYNLIINWVLSLPKPFFDKDPWLQYWLASCYLYINPASSELHFSNSYNIFKKDNNLRGMYLSISGALDAIWFQQENLRSINKWITYFECLYSKSKNNLPNKIEATVLASVLRCYFYEKTEPNYANKIVQRAEHLLKNINDHHLQCQLASGLIFYLFAYGFMPKLSSIQEITHSLIAEYKLEPLSLLLVNINDGFIYFFIGDYSKSINSIQAGLYFSNENGISSLTPWLLAILIYNLLSTGSYDIASGYLKKLREHTTLTQSKLDIAQYHLLIGWHSLLEGDTMYAKEQIKMSLTLMESHGAVYQINKVRYGYSLSLFINGEKSKALIELNNIRDSIKSSPSNIYYYMCDLLSAWISIKSSNTKDAKRYIDQAFKLAKSNGYFGHPFYIPLQMTELYVFALRNKIQSDYVKTAITRNNITQELIPPDLANWPYPIKIYALGRFQLLLNDEEVTFSGKSQKKPLELLKALIAYGGREVRDTRLAETLWPDADGDAALDSLKTNIGRLRKLLKVKESILLNEGKISINPQYCWLDIWAYEHALETSDSSIEHLKNALDYYSDNFLSSEQDAHWILAPRERLRRKFVTGAANLGMQYEQAKNWSAAVECYHNGLSTDHLVEAFYQGLIRCYKKLDQHSEAVRAYQQCCTVFNEQLGIAPAKQTQDLID